MLLTGPHRGAARPSTLAALIDIVNSKRAAHVVTIEDPVEYQHTNRSAGDRADRSGGAIPPDFAITLRSIMRPIAGRDSGWRDARRGNHGDGDDRGGNRTPGALHAAHQRYGAGRVSRILDSFPAGNQVQIRQQLSLALAAIIAQQLVPGVDGASRWPATEIMLANDAVRSLIRKGARSFNCGRRYRWASRKG